MKQIFSSPDITAITHLRVLLESEGIACLMRNEISSAIAGAIPLNESTPQLWVQNDADFATAETIKAGWRTARPAGQANWDCPECGEVLEGQFTSCWKCGGAKPNA